MLAAVSNAKKKRRFFEFELDILRKNPDSAVAENYIQCIPVPHDGKIQSPDDILMFWIEHNFPSKSILNTEKILFITYKSFKIYAC